MADELPTPDYARVVLVPVANPATARNLLQLGMALAHPEEGRVIPLIVTLGDAEEEAKTIEEIEPICEELSDEDHPLELKAVTAPSVSRGILDSIREENADLVVLGLNKPKHGEMVIGAIPESIAETAPCDVLIYRAGISGADYERVIVPANGSDHARIATRVAILLAQRFQKPVEAMYVQGVGGAYWQGRGRLEEALRDIPGQAIVKRTLVTAQKPAAGILSRIEDNDLVIVGYSRRSDFQRWLYGDFSRELLNRSPGPVILTSRLSDPVSDDNILERLWRWARPTLTNVEQSEMVRVAQGLAQPTLDYTVLIIISAILASFGLLTNSGAVIIGAMLVAPLMSPLIAFSVGVATGRIILVRTSLISVAQGFALALLLAFIVGTISPTNIVTPEMSSRGNPTVMELGIALASGFIGAYATARKDIPAALAGVAIAAALMPPVCTIGLGLAYQNTALARGATLLFITNIISIILAAWGVFFWLGMRPKIIDNSRIRLYTSTIMVACFLAVLGVLLLRDVNPQRFEAGVERTLNTVFERDQLVDFDVQRGDRTQVVATIRRNSNRLDDNSEVLAAQQALEELIDNVKLDVVVQPYYDAAVLAAELAVNEIFAPVEVIRVENASEESDTETVSLIAVVAPEDLRTILAQKDAAEARAAEALQRPVTLYLEVEP